MAPQVILDEGKEVLTFVPIEGFGSNRDDQAALCCPWESAPHVQEVLLVTDTLHEPRQVMPPPVCRRHGVGRGSADDSRKSCSSLTPYMRQADLILSPGALEKFSRKWHAGNMQMCSQAACPFSYSAKDLHTVHKILCNIACPAE